MTEKCLAELRHAILTKKSPESISFTVEKLAPLLPLLASSENPTLSQVRSLNELLSRSMSALYKTHPMPALKLAASIFTEIFKLRISPLVKLESKTETNKSLALWEAVFGSVLNGIQSYVDYEHADLVSLGNATYKPLIGILSSPPLPKISARIRVQAYMMLSDAAEGCSENRKMLRDKKVLGGSRLGGMIVATNEYLVLDALFQLLARLTPSASDPEGQAALAAEVFQNPKAKKAFGKEVCQGLACTFRNAKGREWDKAIENIVAEMAKTDLHRTQPFRVIGNVQANSVVYSQSPHLDYVFVDSNGFVVNVQDGENIDSLEIDYMSVISIHITHSSEKAPNAVVHIKVSLSSPPMKGSEPVPSSDSRDDYFSFDIDSNDHDRLGLALKAREMGGYIQQNSSQGRTKRSMGTLDFNNVTITSISLAEKAEIVQHLYVNSSPNPRVVEDTSATKIPDDVVKLPLEPKHKPLIGNPTTPDNINPENIKVKGVTARPEKDPEIVCLPNAKAKKPRPKPLAKPTKKALLDDSDEPQIDLGLLESTFPGRAVSKMDKSAVDLNVERQGLSEPGTKDVDAQKNASISLSKPQSPLKAVKSHKRKRVIESSDEEADDKDGNTRNQIELPYNSQLLLQSDTATTRSSIKYRARAKKAPSSLPATDFDIIPAATSVASSPPILASKSTAKRQRKETKTALEENRTTNESKKSKHEKKVTDLFVEPEESIATRKTQRTSTKPRPDDVEEKAEVKPVTKVVDTVRTKASAHIATNEKPKKSKKSPWKDLDYFVASDDLAHGSSNMPSKVPMVPLAVLRPNTPPSPFNDGSERAEARHIPHQGHDKKGLPCPIAPRNSEPPDLDLVIADTKNLDMNANFDMDPVVSVGDIFDAPLPVSAIADVNSGHEKFGGEMIEPAVESIESEDNQPFSTERTEAETSFTHADVGVIDINNRAQEPSRDVIMIDLTRVDEESSQEERAAIRHKEEPSPKKGSPNKSTLKRSRVSFAHDTKPPSIIKKSTSSVKTEPSSFSGKAAMASMIPRLAMRSDASVFLKEDRFTRRQLRPQNAKIFRKPQRSSTPVVETDSEDEDRVMNSDDKIVAVLNKIQEVIVHRMNTKFDVPRMQAHVARERILASSAEDLEVMLKECFHHSEKLVRLEVEYAEHGRKAKRGLEDLNRMNEDIDRRLRQIISEHDRHSLSKKMSKVLVAPPQIFCG